MKKQSPGWKSNIYIRFSSIGIQMGATIFLFTWLGVYLDDYFKNKTPWLTIILSLFGVIGSLVLVIREVTKLNQQDDSKNH
ncbi:AtpZ/AtpI family protein [Crocinitomicaceae bacterium]|jgi:F0F1-type ATP synthase assembly protein I|nr:AtpZ/AtpI family protein [Crocinitomicaceae bacterium]